MIGFPVVDDLWMTYDDLKPSAACRFKRQVLTLPPSEVHIVLWESRPVTSVNSIPVELITPTRSSISYVQSPVALGSDVPLSRPCATTVISTVSNKVLPLPARSMSPAISQMPVRDLPQPAAPQNSKENCHSSSSIGDRLQRAREKFLRDQNGVRHSPMGAVIPPVSCSVSSVSICTLFYILAAASCLILTCSIHMQFFVLHILF